jgi:hypothetical protein
MRSFPNRNREAGESCGRIDPAGQPEKLNGAYETAPKRVQRVLTALNLLLEKKRREKWEAFSGGKRGLRGSFQDFRMPKSMEST